MDRSRLPSALFFRLKAATRAATAALGSPALSGARACAEVTGASAGSVSRWGAEGYDDTPSLAAAALIELTSGAPHYAALFAELTGHRLVAIADDEAPVPALPTAVHELARRVHRALAALHEAQLDGVIVPGEARACLDDLSAITAAAAEVSARLAPIAARGA